LRSAARSGLRSDLVLGPVRRLVPGLGTAGLGDSGGCQRRLCPTVAGTHVNIDHLITRWMLYPDCAVYGVTG
jgi:hypothetical protein